jgi:hypothetical protein
MTHVQLDRHFAIPRVHSGVVVTARTKEILQSMWHKHTRWLGRTKEQGEQKRAKEVEPDGHGEATRDHELYLNELASMNSMMVVPLFVPSRLGQRWPHLVRVGSTLMLSPWWPHPRALRGANDHGIIKSTKNEGLSYARHHSHGETNPTIEIFERDTIPRPARRLGPQTNNMNT